MDSLPRQLPEWVTALEAAVLTGTTEDVVLAAARSGRIRSTPLKVRRGAPDVLLVRVYDVQAILSAPPPSPVATPEPVLRPAEPAPTNGTGPAPPNGAGPAAVPVPSPAAAAPVVAPAPAPTPAAPAPAPTPVAPAPAPAVAPADAPAVAPADAEGGPQVWSPPSTVWNERPAEWQQVKQRKVGVGKRLRNPKSLALALLAVALLAAAVLIARPKTAGPSPDAQLTGPGRSPASVVWALREPGRTELAVIGIPHKQPALAMAIPDQTNFALPAGNASTAGQSADNGTQAQAVAQTVTGRRVGHYLFSTMQSLGPLIDRLRGIDVQTESSFTFNGQSIPAGSVKMSGSMAEAYLTQGSAEDATGRWEDVLSGILQAPSDPSKWNGVGTSDDLSLVGELLTAARGAPVVELPTAASSQSGVNVDTTPMNAMLRRFGSSLGTLVRVVVVNGSGAPGLGTIINDRLATAGFTVVASQNASHFGIHRTVIAAQGSAFVPAARDAQAILRVGKVELSNPPSSLSDLTIVVGDDFHAK